MGSLLFHVLSPKQLLIDDSYPEAYWGQDAEDLAPHIAEGAQQLAVSQKSRRSGFHYGPELT